MLRVRELSRSDLTEINSWRSDRETVALLGAPFRYVGPEIDEAWFNAYLSSRHNTIRLITFDDSSPSTPLCLTTLSGIDWVSRSAEFHIQVGASAARGRGVGRFSAVEALRHAFDDMGLQRVELQVLASNDRARSLYDSLGFRVEGTRRKAVYKEGRFIDSVIMGLLRDEWEVGAYRTERG